MATPPTASRIARAWSATVVGIEAIPVEVEAHVRPGLPSWTVVGLPRKTVRESRDRVFSALRASSLPVPRGAITVNLAPADEPKDGALFDLPLAAALLGVQAAIPDRGRVDRAIIVGELALDGRVRPVRGVLAAAMAARASGRRRVIVPAPNADEAAAVTDVEVFAVSTLAEAAAVLRGHGGRYGRPTPTPGTVRDADMADVVGQSAARRALEIAATGRHNVLLVGPPGAGKTMLARRLPGLLPELTAAESLEVSRVHSVAGLLAPGRGLLRRPPLRAPHHTVTRAGMIGGGDPPRPGEISLAHRGVLFLDELPEFGRGVLEALRQPMEEHWLSIARGARHVRLPASFLFVGSMNPCPCGRAGTDGCTCGDRRRARYLGRVSGPVRDRIDMHVHVDTVPPTAWSRGQGESSAHIRDRIAAAKALRSDRAVAAAPDRRLSASCEHLLADAITRLGLSARATVAVRGVARTIADLAGREEVMEDDVAEAVQYRGLDRPTG